LARVVVNKQKEQSCRRSGFIWRQAAVECVTSLQHYCVKKLGQNNAFSLRSKPLVLGVMSVDCHWSAFLLLLTVVLRVTSQQPDVTTTRYHGDESSVVSAHALYVNPRPGRNGNIDICHLLTHIVDH